VTARTPAGNRRVLKMACEPLTTADPMNTPPSKNSTVPVLPAVTVAVAVTRCPNVEAVGDNASDVVVADKIPGASATAFATPRLDRETRGLRVDGLAPAGTFPGMKIVGGLVIPADPSPEYCSPRKI